MAGLIVYHIIVETDTIYNTSQFWLFINSNWHFISCWNSSLRSCNSVKRCQRGRPFVYLPTIILRCFIVRVWFRLDSNRTLHHFLPCLDLPYSRRILKAFGLSVSYLSPNSRRTFDRRLKTMSTDIKERISTMANLFVSKGLVKPYKVATDSALLKSNGYVWYVSSMIEGIVPCSGIDTDARWVAVILENGYSNTNFTWYVIPILLQLLYHYQPMFYYCQ